MRKIIVGIWIALIVVGVVVSYVIVSFFSKNLMVNIEADMSRYANRAVHLADPSVLPSEYGNNDMVYAEKEGEKKLTSDSSYLLSSMMSDWYLNPDGAVEEFGMSAGSVCNAFVFISDDGEILRTGTYGCVERGECISDVQIQCYKEHGIYSLLSINHSFTKEQRETMKNLSKQYGMSLKMHLEDCYIAGPYCYPSKVSIYADDTLIEEMELDINIPGDAAKAKDEDLWLHYPGNTEYWYTDDVVDKISEKAVKWALDNYKSFNGPSGSADKGNVFVGEHYQYFGGNGCYIVELQYADFTNTVLVVALPVSGVVFAICAFVGAVLTAIVIIRKKRAA